MQLTLRHGAAPHRRQRGLSIVEVMVGVTVGLFIVAAGAMLTAGQLSANRRLLLDTQIQQDLRAAADVVARELRRAGAVGDTLAQRGMWYSGGIEPVPSAAQDVTPASGTADSASFSYQRSPTVADYGFALRDGRITALLEGTPQEITDVTVMKVTGFAITARNSAAIQLPCALDCPGGGNACWPTLTVREFDVAIAAEAANDPSIKRSINATVRVRNDAVVRDAAVTTGMCPS